MFDTRRKIRYNFIVKNNVCESSNHPLKIPRGSFCVTFTVGVSLQDAPILFSNAQNRLLCFQNRR